MFTTSYCEYCIEFAKNPSIRTSFSLIVNEPLNKRYIRRAVGTDTLQGSKQKILNLVKTLT